MKKSIFIPSILMLILCTSVLCIGIYAVAPTTNNVIGTINLISANPEIEITAYLGTDKATQISDTVTGRTSKIINLYANSLEFVEPEGTNPVADLTLVIEIKNNSSAVDLGAFFLNGTSLPETISTGDILRASTYDGVNADKTTTIENIMAIGFPAYTKVERGAIVDLVCTLSVEELYEEELTSSIELPLVVGEYQSTLENIVIQASSYEMSGTEETLEGTITGSGSFVVGNQITLRVKPDEYDTTATYTYTWYTKNLFGNWVMVTDNDSNDTTYTFTLSATSPTEYKVVYLSNIKKIKISVVTEIYGPPPREYGVDYENEYSIGDIVTLTAYMLEPICAPNLVSFYGKGADGSWIVLQDQSSFSYSFQLTYNSPTEYKVVFFFSNGGSN